MSDNIPFEIQLDIIERIPDIKWVIRCRSVSKAWKSVIDSKEFVKAHTLRCTTHHLLIRTQDTKACENCEACKDREDNEDREDFEDCSDRKVKYVSIVDDETFPHQKHNVFVPDLVNKFSPDSRIVGSCHSLICLYEDKTSTAVIWNPSLRKTVATKVPNVSREQHYRTFVVFGVCPRTLDPKLVKITCVNYFRKLQDDTASTQVEVFTLSSGGTWRSPLSSNVPQQWIGLRSQAVVDGFIYWGAFDRIHVDDGFQNIIMSFNLTSEEFTRVNLPDSLAPTFIKLKVSNLRNSLVVLEFNDIDMCNVWMMIGHGCTRSFNKLYSINDEFLCTTLGFRTSGAPIYEFAGDYVDDYSYYTINEPVIYEPESGRNTSIGVYGLDGTISVHSYMESLLLLGH